MKITEQRMEELLPSNIKDSELSLGTKKVLTALLDWYLTTEARNTGVVIINNSKLCAIAGVSPSTLQEAIRDIQEYGLGRREVGTGLGNASKYYLDFESFTKPLKRKSFEEIFAKELKDAKSSETPISTIVKHSIVEHSRVETSRDKIREVESNKDKSIEEIKQESFIKKLEQKEEMSFANYLFKLSQEKGIEWVEKVWYEENVKFFNYEDLKQFRKLMSALNDKEYKIASKYNKACAVAQKKLDKEISASMQGIEFITCNSTASKQV